MKNTLIYLHLLSFTPPERLEALRPSRDSFVEDWPQSLAAASRLIVSFQQASRTPDPDLVSGLAAAAQKAGSSPEACRAFQARMDALAQLPGRAKTANRLHRKRGCRLCAAPCRYGFFSLVTAANFEPLPHLLATHPGQPVRAMWRFTLDHLSGVFPSPKWHITPAHLGNLSYCLLSLATARSRYPFPEAQMRKFQALNQAMIKERISG